MIELIMSQDIDEVRRLVAEGFCPVECSIGGESIVDELRMDHHGALSNLESVAIRAWRDHRGARVEDPRFVGVGVADADMTFAVAALGGLLPEDDKARVDALAELVARVDSEPIGFDVTEHPQGRLLLMWSALAGGCRDTHGATAAVHLWHTLLKGCERGLAPFLELAERRSHERRERALDALKHQSRRFGPVLVIEGSGVWGFDVWYLRRPGGDARQVAAWEHPVVLALSVESSQITIGCPNQAVAEALFGPGGLRNVFDELQPHGWGGREAVGGSPRGLELGVGELHEAALHIQDKLAS